MDGTATEPGYSPLRNTSRRTCTRLRSPERERQFPVRGRSAFRRRLIDFPSLMILTSSGRVPRLGPSPIPQKGSRMRSRLLTLAGTVALTLGGLTATAGPAAADQAHCYGWDT